MRVAQTPATVATRGTDKPFLAEAEEDAGDTREHGPLFQCSSGMMLSFRISR